MKCTILADNNCYIDQYYFAEPGASYSIEADGYNLLFDTGYSNVFMKNGLKLGVDFSTIDFVVLSHGHDDHTGGLKSLVSYFKRQGRRTPPLNPPRLLAHPDAFRYKEGFKGDPQGKELHRANLNEYFDIQLLKNPYYISENLVYLGEIPRINNYENQKPFGKMRTEYGFTDDYMMDDTAIVYRSKVGLVIITGCSHSGINNIVSAAKSHFPGDPIKCVLGGFHLLNPSAELLHKTLQSLKQENIDEVYAGHCTDLQSKIFLSKALNIKEMGVGLTLDFPDY